MTPRVTGISIPGVEFSQTEPQKHAFYYDIKHTKELGKTQFYPVGLTVPSRFRYLILPGVNNYIRRE
jgi:hypothetical protein